jgi:hypothetical protein
MLKLYPDNHGQPELWESFLPEKLKNYQKNYIADEVLKDKNFVKRFEKKLLEKLKEENVSPTLGRPTISLATYIRLMYLKFRYQLGYETLLEEVSDSLSWRRFCGISLHEEVPDDTTLIKLTNRFGSSLIEQLNRALIDEVKKRRIIKGKKMRLDTTVIRSNIHYPTQSTLLSDGVRVITRLVKKIKKFSPIQVKFVNRLRLVKNILRNLHKFSKAKSTQFKKHLRKKMVCLAKDVVREASSVCKKVKLLGKESIKEIPNLVEKLKKAIELTKRVIKQTEEVMRGNYHIADRVVSIFDSKQSRSSKERSFPKWNLVEKFSSKKQRRDSSLM